jgi:hypothetical protein
MGSGSFDSHASSRFEFTPVQGIEALWACRAMALIRSRPIIHTPFQARHLPWI